MARRRIKITYQTRRVVIFGDLHANWEALLILQQMERFPLAVLCLGDIVGYGPDPKRCVDAVRATATHLVGGQHDRAVGTGRSLSDDELLQDTWAYTRSMLPEADRAFLAGLPATRQVEIEGTRFYMARLDPDDSQAETYMLITAPQARLQKMFGQIEADVILLGGPHIPAMRQVGPRLIVCPGSLGQPRYGLPEPTFVVWEEGRVRIHHLHYQPQATARKLSLLPLDPEHTLRLRSILETGGLE